MRSALLILLALCLHAEMLAQHRWQVSVPRNDHVAYGMDCWENETCIATLAEAIGGTTYMMRTIDRGLSWTRVYEDVFGVRGRRPLGLNTVRFLNAKDVLVTADSGVLLRSSDGGETWREQQIDEGLSGAAGDLDISEDGTGLVSIKKNLFEREPLVELLYSTTDSGRSWSLLPNQPRENVYTDISMITFVATPADGQFLVGFTETIFFDSTVGKWAQDSTVMFAYSSDTGRSWSYHRLDHDSIMFIRFPSLSFFNGQDGVLTGLTRVGTAFRIVARSEDGGRTWDTVHVGAGPDLRQLYGILDSKFSSFEGGYGVVGGYPARTTDGGIIWSRDSVPTIEVIGFQRFIKSYLFNDSVGVGMSGSGSFYYLDPGVSSVAGIEREAREFRSFVWNLSDGPVPLAQILDLRDVKGIRLFDDTGRLVKESGETASNMRADIRTLDVEQISPGVYLLDLKFESGSIFVRMLVR